MNKIHTIFKLIFTLLFLFLCVTLVSGSVVVLNGLTHENNANYGETYRTQIEVQNISDQMESVKVYARDYWYSHKGETRHDSPGTLERSNASWVSFQPELIHLSPNEKAVINIQVKVPEDSLISGSYWSVIMVEGIVPPDTSKAVGVSIRTAIRYAVQLITNVNSNANADLTFKGVELGNSDNGSFLNVVVENTGETLLKPELSMELFDVEGNSVAIVEADIRKTLPGTSIVISLQLEGIKPGVYSGVLVADCGNESIFGTNVSFELI